MGEPIVFLPGMLSDARVFGPQLAELSAEFSTMVVPVHGSETVLDLSNFVATQAPARFALVGHGLGGVIAMDLLRRMPERVTRIALMSTSPLQDTPFDAMAYEPMLIAARMGKLREVVEQIWPVESMAPAESSAAIQDLMLDMARNIGAEGFVRQVRAMQRRRDQQTVLRNCECPALVLCGTHDRLVLPKRHETMAQFLKDGTLVTLPNAGCVPSLESPAETTAALRDWMARPLVLRS